MAHFEVNELEKLHGLLQKACLVDVWGVALTLTLLLIGKGVPRRRMGNRRQTRQRSSGHAGDDPRVLTLTPTLTLTLI